MEKEHIFTSPAPEEADRVPLCVPVTDFLFGKVQEHLYRTKDTAWVTDTVQGTRVLFSEVEPLSRKVASALTRRGFRKGELLYFVTNEMVLLDLFILGAWRCNGAVKGGCPRSSEDDQYKLMKECDTKFVLCDKDTEEHVKNVLKRLPWEVQLFSIGEMEKATSLDQLLMDDGKAFPKMLEINIKEDVIFIPTTGGSTGLPKGAMHTHYSLLHTINKFRFLYYETDVTLTLSNFHISGMYSSLVQLVRGFRIYTIPVFSVESVLEALTRYKSPTFGTLQQVLVWLLKIPIPSKYDLSSLQYIITGGSVIDKSVIQGLKDKFPHLKDIIFNYGATECGLVTSTLAASMFKVLQKPGSKVLSSGVIFPSVKMKIVGLQSGKAVGKGQQGEIRVKADSIMKGYLKRPKDTRESFDEDGWFRTGDIGYFDDNGHLFVVERIKETFKYLAFHICPSELEGLLQTHPAVMCAGVVGVPDPEYTALPRAYVVKKPSHDVTEKQLQRYVEERTPYYKHLRGGVFFVDELPTTGVGKLSRSMLRKLLG